MQSHLKSDTVTNVLGAASGCKLEKADRRDQQGFSIGCKKMLNSIFSPQILHHQHTRQHPSGAVWAVDVSSLLRCAPKNQCPSAVSAKASHVLIITSAGNGTHNPHILPSLCNPLLLTFISDPIPLIN